VSVTLDFRFTTATLVVVLACDGWSCDEPFNAVSRLMLTQVSGIPIPQIECSTLSAPEVVVRDDPIAVR